MRRHIRSIEIPCDYILELESSFFTTAGRKEKWEFCPSGGTGLDRGAEESFWRCVYYWIAGGEGSAPGLLLFVFLAWHRMVELF